MEFGGSLDWIILIGLATMSVLLFAGKGDFLIYGSKGQKKKELEKMDQKKLVRTTGFMTAALAVIQLLICIWGNTVDFLAYAYIPAVILVFVVGIWFLKKKC